eukprot:3210897-Pyramimonas_sp.AAC.1
MRRCRARPDPTRWATPFAAELSAPATPCALAPDSAKICCNSIAQAPALLRARSSAAPLDAVVAEHHRRALRGLRVICPCPVAVALDVRRDSEILQRVLPLCHWAPHQ